LGFAPNKLDALPKLVGEASLLLTATSVNQENGELRAIGLAKAHGLPSLTLLDFWSNYCLRFTNAAGQLLLPDKIAVMDELARSEMIEKGFSPASLVVTGQPAFDRLAKAKSSITPQRRQTLRKDAGVRKTGFLILFISQPFADIYGNDDATKRALGFREQDVLSQCCQTLSELSRQLATPITLAIRPHPREHAEKFQAIEDGSFRTTVWITPDQLEAVLSVDLVLGMNSILLYEAALMGCPVISFQPGLKGSDTLPSNRSGDTTAIYDKSKLRTALEKRLIDQNHMHGGEVSYVTPPPGDSSTIRVLEEIRKLLAKTTNKGK
jgi:hypothetical protein